MIKGRNVFVGMTALLFALLLSSCGVSPGGGTDTTKPVIALNGTETVAVSVGAIYTDAGATATDDVDGNLTDKIVVHNLVDTSNAGIYTVTYDVNDTAGNTADQVKRTVTITVPTPNQSPTAIAGADQVGYVGDPITLDGSASSDPDGTIASYAWREGATILGTGESFVKSDFNPGKHIMTLTVTDNDGATASDSVIVAIYQKLKKTGQTTIYDADGTTHTHVEADSNASLRDDGYYQKGIAPSYTRDNANEIVTDNITGLLWQDDAAAKTVTRNWADAKTYCANLTLGGYSNWRLPTRTELISLIDYGRTNPAINTAFSNTASSDYRSSTIYVGINEASWGVDFYKGDQCTRKKSSNDHVRCVRTEQ